MDPICGPNNLVKIFVPPIPLVLLAVGIPVVRIRLNNLQTSYRARLPPFEIQELPLIEEGKEDPTTEFKLTSPTHSKAIHSSEAEKSCLT